MVNYPPAAHQPPGDRVYLDVPYADKDTAGALGARWDGTARRWNDPHRSWA